MDRDARIAKLRNACGCTESFCALLIAVAAYLLLPEYFPHGRTTVGTIAIGIAVGLGGAVLGKLAGLMVARIRLRRLLRELAPEDRLWSSGAADYRLRVPLDGPISRLSPRHRN